MKKLFIIKNAPISNFQWQKKSSLLLAIVTKNVQIYDRKGERIAEIPIESECKQIQWSWNGLTLAILLKSADILLWDPIKGTRKFETGMKSIEIIEWSLDNENIAAAAIKGSILLIEASTGNMRPINDKNTKGITSIAWNSKSQLVYTSSDKSITLLDMNGNGLNSIAIKGDLSNLQWCRHGPIEKLLVVKNKKSILVYPNEDFTNPIELSMNSKYGSIIDASWINNGSSILVAFSSGFLVSVSTEQSNLGADVYQAKLYKSGMQDISISKSLRRVATCGDNLINVQELDNLKDFNAAFTISEGQVLPERLQFSDDGQFLSVLTKEKYLVSFLSKSPSLFSSRDDRVVYLKNLSQVCIVDFSSQTPETITMDLQLEPSLLSIGPKLFAAAHGDKVVYYEMTNSEVIKPDQLGYSYPHAGPKPVLACQESVGNRTFSSTVTALESNYEYMMVLCENGSGFIHPVVKDHLLKADSQIEFPETEGTIITAAAISLKFFIYATADGNLHHYDLDELVEFQKCSTDGKVIKKIIVQPGIGTKMVVVDDQNLASVFNPLTQLFTPITGWSEDYLGCLWEARNDGRNLFVAWNEQFVSVFSYHVTTTKGSQCFSLNVNTKLPFGFKPVQFRNNSVVCQTLGGTLENVSLFSHKSYSVEDFLNSYPDELDQAKLLKVMYAVGMEKEMWALYPGVLPKKPWLLLAESLLQQLELESVQSTFRMIGDIGMVYNLERILKIEETFEIIGHVFVILGDFDLAQQFFLKSSKPKEALILRRDLLEWDQALALAKKFSPEDISAISLKYGRQLELEGKYGEAHTQFETAIQACVDFKGTDKQIQNHNWACQSGYIRMVFALGDITKGMSLLAKVSEKKLILDCIATIIPLKMFVEAGQLYERIEDWDHAAETYIKGKEDLSLAKKWHLLKPILGRVQGKSVFQQYGTAKEIEGDYAEAATAYEKAKDYDAVTRIVIDKLQNLEGGAALVRKTKARESAKLLSAKFLAMGNYQQAVEFYLIAGMQTQALELAKRHNQMEFFARLVKDEASFDLLKEIALYFESNNNFLEAGKTHFYAMKYTEAFNLFLRCPIGDGEALELAIETIGEARDDNLTHQLIDFLMGEKDGVPKEAKFIFKLYMSLGQYKEAASTALIIAKEEQALGNYKAAHDLLLDNYRQLQKISAPIPTELDRMLMLIHSYVIVKPLVRGDEHVLGARMLTRVSNNISKFPAHTVPILTSTVIECYRAGFKNEAFDFASMLMRPENRPKLDEKFRKKIEQIIRRPEKSNVVEELSPCPFCTTPIPETNLDCSECKSRIPYCIYSGRHMVLDDWSQCPSCKFPALLSLARDLSGRFECCPMCSEPVSPADFVATKPVFAKEEVSNLPIGGIVGGLAK